MINDNRSPKDLALLLPVQSSAPCCIEKLGATYALAHTIQLIASQTGVRPTAGQLREIADAIGDIPVWRVTDSLGPGGDPILGLIEMFGQRKSTLVDCKSKFSDCPLPKMIDGLEVLAAYWRRAEGVTLRWNLNSSDREVTVIRTGWMARTAPPAAMTLPLPAFRLWSSMARWRMPTQLAQDCSMALDDTVAWLLAFAESGLAWFSDFESPRTMPGQPIDVQSSEGSLAMLECVSPTALFAKDGDLVELPFMPRTEDNLQQYKFSGVRFDLHRRAKPVATIEITGDDEMAVALRHLLPILQRPSTRLEIAARLPDNCRAAGNKALVALGEAGLLQEIAPEVDGRKDEDAEAPSVTWLCHAGATVSIGKTSVLVDPIFYNHPHQPDPGNDSPPSVRRLPDIAAVLITHGDNDHLNPSALLRIAPDTPILIPQTAGAGPWQVDIKGVLGALQFSDIRALAPWQEEAVGEIVVTAIPFEGEDWGLELRTLTYLVSGKQDGRSVSVYFGSDSAGMTGVCSTLAAKYSIDFAFLGISGSCEAHVMSRGFGYGSFYSAWIPQHRRARFAQMTNGPAQAAQLASILNARMVFGYAAGGRTYAQTSYCDEGTENEFRERLQALAVRSTAVSMEPGVPVKL